MLYLPCSSSTLEQRSSTCKDFCNYNWSVFSLHIFCTTNLQIGMTNFDVYILSMQSTPIHPSEFCFSGPCFRLPLYIFKTYSNSQLLLQRKICFLRSEYLKKKFFLGRYVLNTQTLDKKIISSMLIIFSFFSLQTKITLVGANAINFFALFLVKTLSKAALFQYRNSFS